MLPLFVENSTISVQASYDSLFREQVIAFGGLRLTPGALVNGSASHDLLMQYLNERQGLDRQKEALTYDMAEFQFPRNLPRQSRQRGIELAAAIDENDNRLKELALRFVNDNSPGEVTGFIALKMFGDEVFGDEETVNLTLRDIERMTAPFIAMQIKGSIVNKLLEECTR